MTTISATTLRNNLASAIDELGDSNNFMLVTNRGKIKSALVDIDLFEDLLALANSEYLESIKKARGEVERGELLSHSEVFGEL